MNTEDLLTKYRVVLSVDNASQWQGEITDELDRKISLTNLRAAWFRKPILDLIADASTNHEMQTFIASEARAFIDTLYSLPNVTWVNDPFESSRAKVKFNQLVLARKLGLRVPKTLITNDPECAKEFFCQCNNTVLAKSIYTSNVTINGVNQGILSRKLSKEEFFKHYKKISAVPPQLQEYIEKQFELRVTIIGDKVFAVKIDSQVHQETKIDWRQRTELNPHYYVDIPQEIKCLCITFLRNQNLLYGAMDFIVTPSGEYVFLENNPFGQYLWLEIETGIPLTDTMCDFLISFLK